MKNFQDTSKDVSDNLSVVCQYEWLQLYLQGGTYKFSEN